LFPDGGPVFLGIARGGEGRTGEVGEVGTVGAEGREGVMEAARTRAAAFFIQYLMLLLAALVWVQFDFVRRRMGAGYLALFYLLIGAAACVDGP